MERELQQVQETIRLDWYQEESTNFTGIPGPDNFVQSAINLIPGFKKLPYTVFGQSRPQVFTTRPPVKTTGYDWKTPLGLTAYNVIDAIPITAVYDVLVIACTNGFGITIVQVRPEAKTALIIGSIGLSDANPYGFLSEISQVSGGSLLPAVAFCYTTSAKTSGGGYYAITSGGVFTASSLVHITDVNFPANQTPALIPIGRFINMNATMYIATLDGTIWNSYAGQNDISAWSNSTGQVGSWRTNAYPDQLLNLARYKNHIVAFGTDSIQFLDDVGNTPCPIVDTQQAFIKFGTFSPRSVCNFGDDIFWIGYGDTGQNGIFTLNGYSPQKVTTPSIDYYMNLQFQSGGDQINQIQLSCGSIGSQRHLLLGGIPFPSSWDFSINELTSNPNDTFNPAFYSAYTTHRNVAYNIDTGMWWRFCYGLNSNYGFTPFFLCTSYVNANIGNPAAYKTYLVSTTSGTNMDKNVMYFADPSDGSPSMFDDYSDVTGSVSWPVGIGLSSNLYTFNTEKRKRINRFKIIRRPIGTNNSANIYSCYLFWSRDASMGQSLTTSGMESYGSRYIQFPHGASGYLSRFYANNLGTGRLWTFGYFEASSQQAEISAFEVDAQQNQF
jgi:hypothetical protein